ncbi:MAG: ABC transporter permease subunit [Actinomycetota bacterium]|nr:ABC transporter permease subunit [Actinomycetota bacterium]
MTASDASDPGFGDVVAAEWIRFRTVRASVGAVAVLAALLPVLAAVVAATGSYQADDTIVGASVLAGATVGQLVAAGLGASTVTGELRSGSMCSTLTACPRRSSVLAAKATVAATVTFAASLVGTAVAVVIGVAAIDSSGHATGDVGTAVVGVSLALAAAAALGVGLGALVRHTGGALAAVLAVVLLPGFVAPMLGDLGRWVAGASNAGALQKLAQSSDATHDTVGSLAAWPSLAVVVATAAGFLVVGARRFGSCDL